MKTDYSDSIKSDKNGYIHTPSIVPRQDSESVLYDTIDEIKSRIVSIENLPPPPPIPNSRFSVDDTYKKITILPNEEKKEEQNSERKWNKTHILLGIMVALLLIVTIVAISVPVAIHSLCRPTDGPGPDKFKSKNDSENNPTSLPSTIDTHTTDHTIPDNNTVTEPGGRISTIPTSTNDVTATTSSDKSAIVSPTPVSSTNTTVSRTPSTSASTTSNSAVSTTPSTATSRAASGSCTSTHRCHSCTCSNSRCPENGEISTENEADGEYEDCPGACFTQVNGHDRNKTLRGCAETDSWKDESRVRGVGCFNIGVSHVCFCCGRYCNKHDMTKYNAYDACV